MSIIFAGLLSLIGPGAGQIFVGKFTEGMIIALLFIFTKPVLVPLTIRFLRLDKLRGALKLLYACNLFYMGLIIYAFVRSLVSVGNAPQLYVWYGLVSAFAIVLTYKNIFNEFIFSSLCGRTEIYNWACGKGNLPTGKKEK